MNVSLCAVCIQHLSPVYHEALNAKSKWLETGASLRFRVSLVHLFVKIGIATERVGIDYLRPKTIEIAAIRDYRRYSSVQCRIVGGSDREHNLNIACAWNLGSDRMRSISYIQPPFIIPFRLGDLPW